MDLIVVVYFIFKIDVNKIKVLSNLSFDKKMIKFPIYYVHVKLCFSLLPNTGFFI